MGSKPPGFLQSCQAFLDMLAELREDIDRYVYMDQQHWLMMFLMKQGLWVTTQYRISRWVHYYFHVPMLRRFAKGICAIWQKLVEITSGVELPNRAEIGGGLFMPHPNGIIVHVDAKLGKNCNLAQQVTIGVGGRGQNRGTPVIGDRAFLGPGARLFGPITLGDDVVIGANAVLFKNLPDFAVAVGVPAKIVSYEGSTEFILYRGCVADRLGRAPEVSYPSEIDYPAEVLEKVS